MGVPDDRATESGDGTVTGGPDAATSAADRRRAVVVAGHRRDEPLARAHTDDPDAAVRAAALSALTRMGRTAPADVGNALADPDPVVRRRAARSAGEMPVSGSVPQVDAALLGALADPDALVVDAACWSIGERGTGGDAAVHALSGVAERHGDARCREAAVGALGALGAHGHRGGLASILRALDDRPAVRRRAAVALAAYGPEGEEALRRCLHDRDWQVRQVAETLLDG